MGRKRFACVLCVVLAACANAPMDLKSGQVERDSALGRTIDRDTRAPMQTDSLVYHLTRQGQLYSVTIPFEYRNDTGRDISIVNCRGGLNIGLEKRIRGSWQSFYWPVLLLCLSPPITIAPGAIYKRAAPIFGALPGSNHFPAFGSSELDGEYRLVWGSVVHDYDANRPKFGEPVGPLRSNPFLLVAPS